MSDLLNMTKKELKELLTPSSLMSVVVVAIMFVLIGGMIGGEVQKAATPTHIGILDADDGKYSAESIEYIKEYYRAAYGITDIDEYIIYLDDGIYGDESAILKAMDDKKVSTALVFSPEYTSTLEAHKQTRIDTYYNTVNMSTFSGMSSVTVSSMISYVDTKLSSSILAGMYGVPAEDLNFAKNPIGQSQSHTYINGTAYEGVTPYQISSALSTQNMFIPIVIMIIIVMIGSIVISSMGNEKENKTLETLLTLPVSRMTIVGGKLIAAGITGLVFGLIYMTGMYFYLDSMTTGSINLADYGLGMTPTYWVLMILSMFLGILCALSLCMILGAFAKNYKSAQTMTMPISMLAVIPMFIMMFSSFSDLPAAIQGVVFAIPFSHPMMAMQNLLFGNMTLVLAGIAYEAIFAAAMIYITVRIYKSDILITGFSMNDLKRLLGKKHAQEDDN
jgi:ABC-2 type transport system permease protein